MVGVLVLVHQNIAELVLVVGQYLRLLPQQRDGVVDDVVEVHGAGGAELFCVGRIDLGHPAQLPISLAVVLSGEVLRALVLILGAADDTQNALGRKGLLIQVQILQNILDDPLGVVGVIDRKVLVKADPVGIPPQDTDTGGVESGGPDIVCHGPQTGRQAVLQLPRRLVGEGDGNDLPGTGHVHGAQAAGPLRVRRLRALRKILQKRQVLPGGPLRHLLAVAAPAVGQQVVDPLNEDRGFAAASPRQQEQRSLRGHGCLALHGVQAPEILGNDRLPGGDVAFVEISHMFTSFL